MYKWLCLTVASLLLLFSVSADKSDSAEFERLARSFPYSVNLYRMLGHDREMRPYYGADDEMAQLIDNLNKETMSPRLRRSGGQQMKSFGHSYSWNTPPIYHRFEILPTVYEASEPMGSRRFDPLIEHDSSKKRSLEDQRRYACRFKFCRIFDA